MLVINSIEKTRLSADSYSYSGTGVAWKARLVLFLGFALMAGGLAGSVVSADRLLYLDENTETELFELRLGCSRAEIRGTGIPMANIILWSCECDRKWADNAEVRLSPSHSKLFVQANSPVG